MKIATYNMQHDRKSTANWAKLIAGCDPDIVLAQESLNPPAGLEFEPASFVWQPIRDSWGSAIYSKSGTLKKLDLPKFQGWVVGAELVLPLAAELPIRLRVFSIHAPTGKDSYQKSVNRIVDMIAAHTKGCDLVVGGDFNLTVSQRHPSEDRVTSSADHKIQQRLRDELGLVNCWQAVNADKPLAQTLRWDRDPKPAFHCDGIFVSPTLASRLESCEVLANDEWSALSDHNSLVAEFRYGL